MGHSTLNVSQVQLSHLASSGGGALWPAPRSKMKTAIGIDVKMLEFFGHGGGGEGEDAPPAGGQKWLKSSQVCPPIAVIPFESPRPGWRPGIEKMKMSFSAKSPQKPQLECPPAFHGIPTTHLRMGGSSDRTAGLQVLGLPPS